MRTRAIDALVERFISTKTNNSNKTKQIISLGAGTDTRYWRLETRNLHSHLIYHEFDFPEIGNQKLAAIQKSSALAPADSQFANIKAAENGEFGFVINGQDASEKDGSDDYLMGYVFHPVDLRKLHERPQSGDNSSFRALRFDVPTLVISECCLCYLPIKTAISVIDFFTSRLSTAAIALYEPINFKDDFGKVMFTNLASRGIAMPTVQRYQTLEDQKERLKDAGMKFQGAADIDFIWEKWIGDDEKLRIARLEMLDEVEEWRLLAQHYTVAWGWREDEKDEGIFNQWMELPSQVTSSHTS